MQHIYEAWDLIVSGILRGGLYALIAIGLSLVFGVMNIANFAYGEIYMIGAYAAFFFFTVLHIGPLPSILAAGLVTFAAGALLEKSFFYTLRRKSKKQWVMNSFLVTLGISIILQNVAQLTCGSMYRGITGYWAGRINWISSMARVVGFLIAIVAITAFVFFLNKTQTGRAIRAVSQDETGASLVGINLNGIHTLTFALSSMLAGIAGACLLSINPAYPTMGINPLYKAWFVAILVGMGNVGASIVGGLIVGLLETVTYMYFGGGWQDVISLSIIILILLVKPKGLFGVKGIKTVLE
ncbi:MAG: branched-chain amino acid ABC transporter permease [Deltaproteobacteria bacterium]|nr:branched-chain amino acid ABC transporter permease [Deltaproteobacteria bacterium]